MTPSVTLFALTANLPVSVSEVAVLTRAVRRRFGFLCQRREKIIIWCFFQEQLSATYASLAVSSNQCYMANRTSLLRYRSRWTRAHLDIDALEIFMSILMILISCLCWLLHEFWTYLQYVHRCTHGICRIGRHQQRNRMARGSLQKFHHRWALALW